MSVREMRSHYESGITRFEKRRSRAWPARLLALFFLAVLVWVGLPMARAERLLISIPLRSTPSIPSGLPAKSVRFHAADGVPLSGWFVPAASTAPSIILVPGFKSDRVSMVPYARFLHAAHFNVLLYDSRGTGGSSGSFTFGVDEVNDVRGAVTYLDSRNDLRVHRYGLLSVSLGSGEVIVAAPRLSSVQAIVADSPFSDQTAAVSRLDTLHVGSISVPLAPVALWYVERVCGIHLASFSPLHAVSSIAPRGLLLIHSRYDTNPTTPLSGALALKKAAGPTAALWIAPKGGHAGALMAQPAQYAGRVVSFLRRYLG